MPRWACRLTLELFCVDVQLLTQISRKDRVAEGIDSGSAVAFQKLWDGINGKTHPWGNNPWVWALRFKRVEA